MAKRGRPRKNALVELSEQEDKTEEVAAAESEADPSPAAQPEKPEVTEEEVIATEGANECCGKKDDNKSIPRDVLLRLKELVLESVRRSNHVGWRKEGKALISEIDKALE